jgi:hypothetical protein
MGAAGGADMSAYMDLFSRHAQLHRRVEEIPGGVRTITEADTPDLVARLQGHVSAMYSHFSQGQEVRCMSPTLPILFAHAGGYRRTLSFTATGVVAEETATEPALTAVIRAHAREVTGFVDDGMAAMMRQMMGPR